MVAKRSLSHWRLLSTVVIGVLLSSTVMAGTVIYFDALRELALKNSLDQVEPLQLDILLKAERGPTTLEEYGKVRRCDDLPVRRTAQLAVPGCAAQREDRDILPDRAGQRRERGQG